MAMTEIILLYSLVSGIFSILLIALTLFFEKNKKKSRALLIWAMLFLFSAFLTTEYTFWIEGYNLFKLVWFNFPLIVFFGIWLAFIIWLFETRKERRIWIVFLILLVIGIIVAVYCMNCITF